MPNNTNYTKRPVIDRIMDKVTVLPNGCWEYRGCITSGGYGLMNIEKKNASVHRVMYIHTFGPIPEDRPVVDHTCHDPKTCSGGSTCPHRRCVNPEHLNATTYKDNSSSVRSVKSNKGAEYHRNKTHCVYGHEYTPDNTRLSKGSRMCRQCQLIRDRRRRALLKLIPKPPRPPRICKRGHLLSGENIYIYRTGRQCLACKREYAKNYIDPRRTKKPKEEAA